MTASQEKVAKDTFGAGGKLNATASIEYENSVENGKDLAESLRQVLLGAEVNADVSSAASVVSSHSYPGLSFDCVDDTDEPLAAKIEAALKDAKVVNKDIKRNPFPAKYCRAGLRIIIRKP